MKIELIAVESGEITTGEGATLFQALAAIETAFELVEGYGFSEDPGFVEEFPEVVEKLGQIGGEYCRTIMGEPESEFILRRVA